MSKDGANIINKGTLVCGDVQVIEFPNGKMILEYNPGEEPCTGGMFLPFFPGEFIWGIELHTIIFCITLLFSFLGISIIADVFMAAIEVITSKTRTVTHVSPSGKKQEINVQVWNPTIANLTLMALGSSAPEILLSVLETVTQTNAEPVPGGLGPGTIVGSAAFNLLVICAICVMAIPKAEGPETGTRKIKAMGVFSCTAFFSVFAYLWLYICVKDNNVELWEAVVTLLFFPVMVVLAYMLDRRDRKNAVTPADQAAHVVGTSGMGGKGFGSTEGLSSKLKSLEASAAIAGIIVKKEEGFLTPREIAVQKRKVAAAAVAELQSEEPVSVMQAKINARRALAGRQRVVAPEVDTEALDALKAAGEAKKGLKDTSSLDMSKTYIAFESTVYSVFEDKGHVDVVVVRKGNTASNVSCRFNTVDGEAVHGSDFEFTTGVLTFKKGELKKTIRVKLVDDNDYEPDERFFIELNQPKPPTGNKGTFSEPFEFLGTSICSITILDDQQPGTMSLDKEVYAMTDGTSLKIKIQRTDGADGEAKVLVKTKEGTAKAGVDFEAKETVVTFADMQAEAEVDIHLVNDEVPSHSLYFSVQLQNQSPGLRDGAHMHATINIVENEAYAQLTMEVAELMKHQFESMSLETTTWGNQFHEAMNIAGEDSDAPASNFDYIMHFLTFGWKVMFATVPPTSYGGGWITFFVALGYIGVLTAFVADIAGIFGCLLGLDDAITAITFVALGTSLPDTFASKTAAVNDDTADASVGNVTGSNSVNVFLGLGLPWVLATVINTAAGFTSKKTEGRKGDYPMIAGSLGFSVVVFAICAVVCIGTIYLRRFTLGYELGGKLKYTTGAFFCSLWLVYVMVSSLETKGKIESFMPQ